MGEMPVKCIIKECNQPIQQGRPHGWTCEGHDVVERPYAIHRARVEAQRKKEAEHA